ncbi:hypothetical protein GOEFS_051_00100 [Gordonia effusa NBRC 100432]|uniref:Chaperone protein DnaK n=1 Tax=Gordonia effusa NBRC 100432 TaxID=1077974 RepID=H0QZR4_9ACTN|nr:Hsp70 family protein [Gordonia effusa]GAB18315.1 hypothetical protein GOEFS_051_00100 [Gordonia effusa NBRC 100432]
MKPWRLSIDIGTSNTAAAHTNSATGVIEALRLTPTSNLMPSAVLVMDAHTIVAGTTAVNQAEARPHAFIPSPKLLLTRNAAATVMVDGHSISVTQLLSALVSSVLAIACARHADVPPRSVVLTHPQAWSAAQTRVLLDAAVAAGLDETVLSLMPEPEAAGRHYATAHSLPAGSRLGIFDFGGGTLDVSVLAMADDGTFTVVGAGGDADLGGRNFDARLHDWVHGAVDEELGSEAWESVDPLAQMRLIVDIRAAKEVLSEAPAAAVTVDTADRPLPLQITRPEFEDHIASLISRAVDLAHFIFSESGPVRTVYLTGGSSAIPLVQRSLSAVVSVATLDDPKLVIAEGALTTNDANTPSDTPTFEPTRPATQSKRRGAFIAVATAVVAVMVGAVMWWQHDDSAAPTAPDTSMLTSLATTESQVRAALPSPLNTALQSCARDKFTDYEALLFQCQLSSGDSLFDSLGWDGTSKATVGVDVSTTRREVAGAREGITLINGGVVTENSGRTATAVLYDDPLGWRVDYANATTGVLVELGGFSSRRDISTFLERSGLMN